MRRSVAHRAGGASDVGHGNDPFQPVVSCLVKEVAETDHSHSFADKVHGEALSGAAEDANHRIQFLSTTLQIGASHGEVRAIQSCCGDEQRAILFVPESRFLPHARGHCLYQSWSWSLDKRGARVWSRR